MGENEEKEEIFRKGSRVEVSSNEEGFAGAWYVATVLSTTPSSNSPKKKKKKKSLNPQTHNNMFLVKYDTLLNDDVKRHPLTEDVDVSFLRPLPPTLETSVDGDGHYVFEVNDVVDAFHRDGWWTGVVTAVVDDCRSRFMVYFHNPPDVIECHGSDLRLHLDWAPPDWVRPDKQEVLVPSSGNQEKSGYSNGNANYAMDLMNIERASSDAAMDNSKPDDSNSNADVTRSLKKFKARNAVEGQPSITPPCRLVITRNKVALSGFITPAKVGTRNDFLKKSSDDDQLSAKNKSHSRKKTESKEQTVGGPDSGSTILTRKKRRAKKRSHSEKSNASAKGNERKRFTTEKFLKKESIEDVMFAKETRGSEAENYHLLPEKASLESVKDQDPHATEPEKRITEMNESKGEESRIRKKRGRPRKSLGKIPKGSAEETEEPLQGNSSEVYKLDCGAKDATDVTDDDELPSNIFDEQPLLMWLDGMKSAKVLNNAGISHGMALDPRNDANDGQNDVVTPTPSPAVVVSSGSVEKSQILPFAMCSPVWNSIDSLEVFRKNPQRPHFSPLVGCKEDSREGLAIGHMVTFANLVERTLKLQLSDPQSIIESSLETLAELENHGFNVEGVRKRLNELQALKVRVAELEESSKEAEGEIMKLDLEKRELEEMMDKVEMKMRQIQEKLAAAASMKETKVKNIDDWQSKASSIVDSMENAKRDFERVAASPL